MRIAHVIWGLGTGGAETMLIDIVNIQVETETVSIIAVNDLLDESLLGMIDKRCIVKLLRRKVGSKSLTPWIRLNVYLFRFKPNIIHFHLEGMRNMVFHPAPKVFTIHNAYSSNREYLKYQALFAISDGVKHYTEQQGFNAVTVWNGIDTKAIRIREKKIQQNTICRMVCVGRLRFVHKGQDVLIMALSILKHIGVTNYHLDFIGDGESREELEKMLDKYGLQEQVTILGQRNRHYIYKHLCDYDLYVLPSRSEGFGLTVAEAMCAKVPVLVSDLEGPMGVIDGGRLGMSFNSEDPQSLANQIKAFIELGEDAGQIEKAYQHAVEFFDISRTAKQYIEEYKKVLDLK